MKLYSIFAPLIVLLVLLGCDNATTRAKGSGASTSPLLFKVFPGGQECPSCLACSPDGRIVVTGSNGDKNGSLKVWDLSKPKLSQTKEELGSVLAVAFSRDDKSLAFGGSDGVLRVLSTNNWMQQRAFPGKNQ